MLLTAVSTLFSARLKYIGQWLAGQQSCCCCCWAHINATCAVFSGPRIITDQSAGWVLCLSPPSLPPAPEAEAKASLLALMREWLQEKVAMADKVLVEHAVTKVYDGDTILTYAYSQVRLSIALLA